MEEHQFKTSVLENQIECCEDILEFKELVAENAACFLEWRSKIGGLMMKKGLTKTLVAEGCRVSCSTAKRFKRAIPSKRVNVIKLACMLGLSVEQTDELLVRYAKFQKLYPKNSEDFIWIYMLNQGGTMEPAAVFDEYKKVLDGVCNSDLPAPAPSTGQLRRKLLSAHDEREFKSTASFAVAAFREGNQKLLEHIDLLFAEAGTNGNDLFSGEPYFKNLHRRTMKALRERRSCPDREYLVALGLKLGLDTRGINTLLAKAEMGPLCAKDRLDSAMYYFIEELSVICPAYFEGADYGFDLQNEQEILDCSIAQPKAEDLAFYIYERLQESGLPFDEKAFRELAKKLSGNSKERAE